jgi:hypothetical protein
MVISLGRHPLKWFIILDSANAVYNQRRHHSNNSIIIVIIIIVAVISTYHASSQYGAFQLLYSKTSNQGV